MTRTFRKRIFRRQVPPLDEIVKLALVHGRLLWLFDDDEDFIRRVWETHRSEILKTDPEPWALAYFGRDAKEK